MPGISPHEASLICDSSLDVIHCRCRCGLLKRGRSDVSIGRLLDAVDRATVLIDVVT